MCIIVYKLFENKLFTKGFEIPICT